VVPNSMMFRVASLLTGVGIVLVLPNWYAKPEAALAWTAVLAMFAVMVGALRVSQRVSTAKTTAVPGLDSIPTAVVFAALMMGIPLALTLARSYGLVDGSDDLSRRSTGVLIGAFLMMLGNVMPKNLPPPVSSMRCDGARQQAFQRRAGWTWVLCGLASAIGWLALPIDSAEIAAIALPATALVVTIVHLVHLSRQRNEPAHGLN
jgi:hypothetical protein